jgi:hypothetical protein
MMIVRAQFRNEIDALKANFVLGIIDLVLELLHF